MNYERAERLFLMSIYAAKGAAHINHKGIVNKEGSNAVVSVYASQYSDFDAFKAAVYAQRKLVPNR